MKDLVQAQGYDSYKLIENDFFRDVVVHIAKDYEQKSRKGQKSTLHSIIEDFLNLYRDNYWSPDEFLTMVNSLIIPNIASFNTTLQMKITFLNATRTMREEDILQLGREHGVLLKIGAYGVCEVGMESDKTMTDKNPDEKPKAKRRKTPFTSNQIIRGWLYVIRRAKIMFFMSGSFPVFTNDKYWGSYVEDVDDSHTAFSWAQKVIQMKNDLHNSGLNTEDLEFVKLMMDVLDGNREPTQSSKDCVAEEYESDEKTEKKPQSGTEAMRTDWKMTKEEAENELLELKKKVKETEKKLLLLEKQGRAIDKLEKLELKLKKTEKKNNKK